MRFSKITNGFYPKSVPYKNLPADIINITQDEYAQALPISPDKREIIDGKLVILADTIEQLLSSAKVIKLSAINISFLDDIKSGFITSSGIKMNIDITDIQRLKSAYDLAILLNENQLPIVVDYDNFAHVDIPLPSVLAMIIEMGIHYQLLYAKKQTVRRQVMLPGIDTQAALDDIVW